jgi:hypothetical protein
MQTPKRKEVAAYSLLRRLHNKLIVKKATLPKRMDLSFVTLGEQIYKRIIFVDNFTPQHYNKTLYKLAPSGYFPEVFHQYENELWVEYIEGKLLDGDAMDEQLCKQFAQFYVDLYSIDYKHVDAQPYLHELQKTLQFHQDMKIITPDEHKSLSEHLAEITPSKVWQGYDYTDAITKNFLISSGDKKLIAIDIESIQADSLLGCGPAKAFARWMSSSNFNSVMNHIMNQEGPAFYENMDFIHLYFRAHWLKKLFLRNKLKRLKQNQHLLKNLA